MLGSSVRRLYLLRFVDAFAFSYAWLSLGLWAARTGGTAAFAQVTTAIYVSYPLAIWLLGPVTARFKAPKVARWSAVTSGAALSCAFIALHLDAGMVALLALIAVQSLAGSAAAELIKHSAARRDRQSGLPVIMVAYRAGLGLGGLSAGLILASSRTAAVLLVGIAAAWASTGALLVAAGEMDRTFTPKKRSHPGLWLKADPAGNLAVLSLSVSVAAGVAIAPGVVAEQADSLAAGTLTALIAAGALLGPKLRSMAEKHPKLYPILAVGAAAALAGLHGPAVALLTIPFAAVAFDIQIVRQETTLHNLYPDEPGAVAVPGVMWSLGVAAAAVPLSTLLDMFGATAIAAAAAALIFVTQMLPANCRPCQNTA